MLLLMSAFITFDTYEANLIFKLNLYTIKKNPYNKNTQYIL